MQYFGKVLGMIIGLLSGIGFWGLLIGLIIGYIADKITSQQVNKNFLKKQYQNLFFSIIFQVMGHITKSKGRITSNDIKIAYFFMKKMQLNFEECNNAKKDFIEGKQANYPLRKRLKELKKINLLTSNLIKIFLEIQIQVAFSDGVLHPNEKNILCVIAEELGISQVELDYLLYNIENKKQENFTLIKACKILGVNINDSYLTIKRAYKKLMSKYHPDKLIAKGLSQETIDIANKKTQEIQSAFNFIKKEKRFK